MEQRERLIGLIRKAETEFANSNRPVLDIEKYVAELKKKYVEGENDRA